MLVSMSEDVTQSRSILVYIIHGDGDGGGGVGVASYSYVPHRWTATDPPVMCPGKGGVLMESM